jgi:hypothetical protein
MGVINISAAVGKNASNRPGDVRTIQATLNDFIERGMLGGVKPLAIDGKCGNKTNEAILMLQNQNGLLSSEHLLGQIHPQGMTISFMNRNSTQASYSFRKITIANLAKKQGSDDWERET